MFGAQEVSWICPPDCDNTSFLDDSPYWQADFTTFVKSSPINAHSVPNAVHLLLDKGMPKLVRASTQRTHRVPATTWGVGWRPYAFRRLLLSARYLLTVGGARHRMHMVGFAIGEQSFDVGLLNATCSTIQVPGERIQRALRLSCGGIPTPPDGLISQSLLGLVEYDPSFCEWLR